MNDHKTCGNFEKLHTMYSKSDNIEVMMGNEKEKIIEEFFDTKNRYQKHLKESMRGSEFVFYCVDSLYYKLHKIPLIRGGSYIDPPQWLKNKQATINPRNNDDKCFQYPIPVALNHEQIKSHPERMSNIIDRYDWKEINFPSNKKDWNDFEK